MALASRPLAARVPAWAVPAVAGVVSGAACAAFLGDVGARPLALLALVAAIGVAAFVGGPPSLMSAKTWILGYLALSVPLRALYLTTTQDPYVPILWVFPQGGELDRALVPALLLSALGVVAFGAGYGFRASADSGRRPPRPEPSLRTARAWSVLLLGAAAIPFKLHLAEREVTGGGDFALSLAGYVAVGVAASVAFRWARGADDLATASPRRRPGALLVASVLYAATLVVLLGSKLTALSMAVSLVVGYAVRRRAQGRRWSPAMVVRGALLVAVVLLVFAQQIVMPRADASPGDRLAAGAGALASRSYGVDGVMAVSRYLEDGHDLLWGGSLAEATYSWVPRQVWPGKPRSFSQRIGTEVFDYSPLAGEAFFAPSLTGELLLNFSVAGVLAGWWLLGAAAAFVDRRTGLAMRVLAIIALTHGIEGPLVVQVWLGLPMVLAGWLILRPATDVEEPPGEGVSGAGAAPDLPTPALAPT